MSNFGQVRSPWRTVLGLLAVLVASLAFSSSASAAGAPIVTEEAEGSVPTFTRLNFWGTVNPNGAATTYKWEYGTTTSLGSETAPVSAGEGTTAQVINTAVNGLLSSHKYYFRLSATNNYGTSVSSIDQENDMAWRLKTGTFPQHFTQDGTVTFKMPYIPATIECGISPGAGGTIEAYTSGKGVINLYELGLRNCVYVGSPNCNPTSITGLRLGADLRTLYAEQGLTTIHFNQETCGVNMWTLLEREPFRITKMPTAYLGHDETIEFAGNTQYGVTSSTLVEITVVLNMHFNPELELYWAW